MIGDLKTAEAGVSSEMSRIVEAVRLRFAARRLRRTLKMNAFSEARSSAILDYYLLPFNVYACKMVLRLDVRDWIIRQLNRNIKLKLTIMRRRSLRKMSEGDYRAVKVKK